MTTQRYERVKKARKIASEWRDENRVYHGFVMILRDKVHSFEESLPDYKMKSKPCAVDPAGAVFVWSAWGWINVDTGPDKGDYKEHISKIAKEELCHCYPAMRDKIVAWFDGCTVPLNSSKWRMFENLVQKKTLEMVLSGRGIDYYLSK